MFRREFPFTDYNGNEKKKTYWFSLEKDEMLRLELGNYGGLEHAMNKMMAEERPDKVLDMLEGIVLSAVGEISPDGESFYKTDEIRNKFRNTKVCHDLLFELMSDQDALKNFILGAIPADLAAAMAADKKEDNVVPMTSAAEEKKE